MKKIFSVIGILILAAVAWYFVAQKNPAFEKFVYSVPTDIKNFASTTIATEIQNVEQQVLAPPPLKNPSSSQSPQAASQALTDIGVINLTNQERLQNGGLPALKENKLLDASALLKLNDLFKQQYFEHINPQGIGPSDLANEVGYSYITIGENLALGQFKNNQDLITAWMNSPGHRANILNAKFMEIGVAVGRGDYQGQTTWIAVQEFGKPSSSCPVVDANLKSQINQLQSDINQLQPQLDQLKSQIDASQPKTQSDYDAYNQLVAEYNSLVKIFNNKVDSLKLISNQYNAEVRAYNLCAAS